MSSKTNPRILILHKGGRVHTWCEDLQLGFAEIGHDVRVVALRDRTPQEREIEKNDGLRFFSNPATNNRICETISRQQPDLIILLNHVGLTREASDAMRQAAPANTRIIGWLADHITKIPAECLPILDGVHYFDSASLPILDQFYEGLPVQLAYLPLAVNPARFPDFGKPWDERRKGLVFVGNHTPKRIELIRQIRKAGLCVHSYGPRADAAWRVWRGRRLTPAATAKLYGAYQAVLNQLQYPNTIHGLNLRAYEIPASGGLSTYPVTPDLETSFVPGEEIIAYRNVEDLTTQLQSLFNRPDQVGSIIHAGRARVLRDHTYAHRAQTLLNTWLSTP